MKFALKELFIELYAEMLQFMLEAEYDTMQDIKSLTRRVQRRKYLRVTIVNIAKPKEKSIFPSNEALLKMLYKTKRNATRKWTGRVQYWD
ncbi:hypothetical protein KZX70_22090 [Paenibacillus silvae]|nr:hypothetical protein [Paenibacillus silvae]MCK6270200.1 hypothetical protein [Paenibacillus silvae]